MKFTKFIVALQTLMMVSTPLFSLSAPSNLTLSNITEESITLNWTDTSNDETGFKIYRNNILIDITKPNTTTYTDANLMEGTDYTYTVKATDDLDDPLNRWVTNPYSLYPVKMIYASPNNPTLFADYQYEYAYKTVDAGITWQYSNDDEIESLPYVISPQIFKEVSTEEQIPENLKNYHPDGSFSISNIEHVIQDSEQNYYVASQDIYKVLVNGSWIKLTSEKLPSYGNALYLSNKVLYVGTYWNGIYKYENNQWSHISNGLPENRGINGIAGTSDGTLYTVVHDQIGGKGIYKYIKNSNSWININYGLSKFFTNNTWHIIINSNDEVFINTYPMGIFKLNKYANNWLNISHYTDRNYPVNIDKLLVNSDGDIFAISGEKFQSPWYSYGIYKSSNNGKTWQEYTQNITDNQFLIIKDMAIDTNDTLYASTHEGYIYQRKKNDLKWKKIFKFDAIPYSLAVDKSNNNLYVGTLSGGIYRKVSGSSSFESIQSGLPPIGNSTVLDQLIASNDFLVVKIYDGQQKRLFSTQASNINWQKLAPLSESYRTMTIINGILYVGTDNGVYKYQDGSWVTINQGLNNSQSLQIRSFAYKNNVLYIGTYDGVYKLGGNNSWEHISSTGLVRDIVKSLAVDDGYIYVGTYTHMAGEYAGFFRYKYEEEGASDEY